MAEHGEGMFAIPILQLTLRKMDMGTGSNGRKQVRNACHGAKRRKSQLDSTLSLMQLLDNTHASCSLLAGHVEGL